MSNKVGVWIIATAVILCFGFPLLCCGGCLIVGSLHSVPPRPTRPPQVARASPELQADRQKAIQAAKGLILDRLDTAGGTTVKAYVLPAWYDLTHEEKQKHAAIWAAWVFAVPKRGELRLGQHLPIRDARTGKTIGNLTKHGLSTE